MDDDWIAWSSSDKTTGLAGLCHNNVATAQAFIQRKKFHRIVRSIARDWEDGKVSAANRAKKGVTRCGSYLTGMQHPGNRGRHN
jgi:hypothetical protein